MITRAPTIDQSDMDFVYGEDGAINLNQLEKGEKQKPLRRSSQVFEEDPPMTTVSFRTAFRIGFIDIVNSGKPPTHPATLTTRT